MTLRPTSRWPAAVALGLSLATLAVVGCTGRTPPAAVVPVKDRDGAPGADAKAEPKAVAKPLADWPDDLAGVLIVSGEMLGYTAPCGCTGGQLGGLIRRMTFLDLVRTERKWPVALIDLGGLLNDPNKHGGRDQTAIKLNVTLRALTLLKYSAVALGVDDLKLGAFDTLMAYLNTLPAGDDAPKIVAANVVPAAGFETHIRPSIRAAVGPRQVGITAVMDPAAFAELRDEAKMAAMTVSDPEATLAPVLADLEKSTDLQVLMVQGPPSLAEKLGLAFPGFDVVVATTPFTLPETRPKTLNGGTTWLMTVGQKGQYLGAIGLPRDKSADRLYQRIELNDRYDAYKGRAEAMRKLLDEDFVGELKSAGVLASYPKHPYRLPDGNLSKARYVGAETCKECHPKTFAKWAETGHARAYDALTADPKRNREADADCVRCHTTGFEHDGGFVAADAVPNLKGNQCENCHGPGSLHAAAPDDEAIRKTVARSAVLFKDRCLACHDEDNAPHGFDFDKMWLKIMHPRLDNYDDPKVHQGIAARK